MRKILIPALALAIGTVISSAPVYADAAADAVESQLQTLQVGDGLPFNKIDFGGARGLTETEVHTFFNNLTNIQIGQVERSCREVGFAEQRFTANTVAFCDTYLDVVRDQERQDREAAL